MSTQTTRSAGKKSDFNKRWKWNRHAPMRRFWNFMLRWAYSALMRLEVRGLENIPIAGPGIAMINHVNFFDPVVVLASLGRTVIPMGKVEAFEDWRLRPLIVTYGVIPVHRGVVDMQAIRSATEVLRSGELVLISPEGTRSPTGGLIQGQEGLAFLAARTGAPILPVAIVGTPHLWPMLKTLHRAHITITIGKPLIYSGEIKPSREQLSQFTDQAMRALAAMLPEEMRGIYG
jgi:1-acyl-sn-glycerol-3-phosphate acyltransferase